MEYFVHKFWHATIAWVWIKEWVEADYSDFDSLKSIILIFVFKIVRENKLGEKILPNITLTYCCSVLQVKYHPESNVKKWCLEAYKVQKYWRPKSKIILFHDPPPPPLEKITTTTTKETFVIAFLLI